MNDFSGNFTANLFRGETEKWDDDIPHVETTSYFGPGPVSLTQGLYLTVFFLSHFNQVFLKKKLQRLQSKADKNVTMYIV